jgi:hypothetical protein
VIPGENQRILHTLYWKGRSPPHDLFVVFSINIFESWIVEERNS